MDEGGVTVTVSVVPFLTRLVEASERSAKAQEDLIRLATEERSAQDAETPVLPGLPICPHCETLNPEIRNEGGSGPFAEFALLAQCGNCQKMFIAVAQGWDVFKDKAEYEGRENGIDSTRSNP